MAQFDPDSVRPGIPVAPQYQAQPPAEVVPVERPSAVTRAVQLMYVGAALSVVGIVASWATRGQLRDQATEQNTGLTASEVDSLVTIGLAIATVIGLVAVGLWLWMAAANGAGKSWARVLSTVLGGLSIVLTLIGLSSTTGLATALQLVSVVLAVVILVLLWRPASSAYFRARSQKA